MYDWRWVTCLNRRLLEIILILRDQLTPDLFLLHIFINSLLQTFEVGTLNEARRLTSHAGHYDLVSILVLASKEVDGLIV